MGDAQSKTWTRNPLVVGGVLVLVLAVAVFVVTKSKDATCALTAAGVSSVVLGVTHEKSVEQIVGTAAAGALVPEACKAMVESLIGHPSSTVTFELTTPTGTQTQTASGNTILTPPSPAADTGVQRIIDCFISFRTSKFLDDLCVKGVIEPH
ncbi:MAG: hypothetical protein M3P43_13790 [Actinomycetota bacterium]|nr:hypothetical protein [Actinomycetota bacterium]